MAASVFIDGAAGTTGLEIAERLAGRSEFELVILDDERRKDEDQQRHADEAPYAGGLRGGVAARALGGRERHRSPLPAGT